MRAALVILGVITMIGIQPIPGHPTTKPNVPTTTDHLAVLETMAKWWRKRQHAPDYLTLE